LNLKYPHNLIIELKIRSRSRGWGIVDEALDSVGSSPEDRYLLIEGGICGGSRRGFPPQETCEQKGDKDESKLGCYMSKLAMPPSLRDALTMCMVCGKYSPESILFPSFPQFSTERRQLSTVLGV
jgi:hypothetical protein